MSTAIAKVAVAVIANTQGFSNGMQRAAKDVRILGSSVKREQDTLDRLKATFGESSKFGRLAMILGGAGAAGAAMLLARTLGNAANEMNKVTAEIRAGEKGFGDLIETALGAVPVIGEIWKAGRTMRQTFLDASTALLGLWVIGKPIIGALETDETALERLQKEEELIRGMQEALAKAQAKLRQETLTGVAKEKAAIEDRYAAEMRRLEELRQALDSIREDGNRKAGLFALQQLQETLKAIRDAELSKASISSTTTTGPKTISALQLGSGGTTDMSRFVTAQRDVNAKQIAATNNVAKSVDFAELKISRLIVELAQIVRSALASTPGL